MWPGPHEFYCTPLLCTIIGSTTNPGKCCKTPVNGVKSPGKGVKSPGNPGLTLLVQNKISPWLRVSVISPYTACQKKEISCAKNIVNILAGFIAYSWDVMHILVCNLLYVQGYDSIIDQIYNLTSKVSPGFPGF